VARTVKEFPYRGLRGNEIYPWDEWLNGEVWELTEEDLAGMEFKELARYSHKVAKDRNLACRTVRGGWDKQRGVYTTLHMQAYNKIEGDR
tara:strand:+ start:1703 stop:1972 length:270 start_codon:yes stop_codon:yes gene_type:complete